MTNKQIKIFHEKKQKKEDYTCFRSKKNIYKTTRLQMEIICIKLREIYVLEIKRNKNEIDIM